jgi:hypothetical protein
MVKTIKLSFPEIKTTVSARLHEDLAPKTCEAVWGVLPFDGKAIHGKWGGNEVWTSMPDIKISEFENETIFASPGEILIVIIKPGIYDFAMFYGKGWCFGPSGFVPGNHFATIAEDLPKFVKACEKVHLEGSKKIIIEKGD